MKINHKYHIRRKGVGSGRIRRNPHNDLAMARQSLVEELTAINDYQKRINVTSNLSLKSVLEHIRNEEKEHTAELIKWIRRNDK